MTKGYLAIVLHAHLPFVRHPEKERYLEENWFYQAVTECYFPLLDAFNRLAGEGFRFRITLSLSPPLITMLTDALLTRRYVSHLERLVRLAEAEEKRTAGTEFHPIARMYRERFQRYYDLFINEYRGNLVSGFASLQSQGVVELITTCATHGYLPLIHGREAQRAQILTGLDLFERHFGVRPQGFWLPECGYMPGVDELLASVGIKYFFIETHGVLTAYPPPLYGIYAPVVSPAGVAAFGRDPDTSRQVWDRQIGYPGDYWYREYYRDIGYELPWEYIEPFLPSGEVRTDTGVKYYRITGRESKEPYNPQAAQERAAAHAEHFLYHRQRQISYWAERLEREPIVVAPYDAELFGHWWFEGPQWLEFLIRKVSMQDEVALVTPSDYLAAHPRQETATISHSSWGEGGYSEVWLNPGNDWIYQHTHHAETLMVELCDLYPEAQGNLRRALSQAARELLLAESSDWAFILRVGSTVEYAKRRIQEHISRFNSVTDQILNQEIDEITLEEIESLDNIFPGIDYRVYSRFWSDNGSLRAVGQQRILILSWEYPPRVVGGLGRHVYDLSRALVRLGNKVTVITAPAPGYPLTEEIEGVEVCRVQEEDRERDFLDWVAWLNKEMIRVAERLLTEGKRFNVIHGHDWLIETAARELTERYNIPLVATIHATEYGRYRGIHNETQFTIHSAEKRLAQRAERVICCSGYMMHEVSRLFGIPLKKIQVIPNGVDPEALGVNGWRGPAPLSVSPVVLFLGRLVPEKGVQDLIRALPLVAERVPGVQAVLCGQGPYKAELERLAEETGIAGRVRFAGFVDGAGRNRLLQEAGVAVFPSHYEPFGIVALEAMAAQIPVIVGDTGGLGEVVEHGIDGFKVPPGRPDMLSRYIGELLTNRSLANELCRRGWRKVRSSYDWRHIAAVTCEVYARVSGKLSPQSKVLSP